MQLITDRDLLQLLPGNKFTLDISSWPLANIVQALDRMPSLADTVVLLNGDIFRHHYQKSILEHKLLQNKKLFLTECGYQNKQINPTQWILSWPKFYFIRHQVPKSIKSSTTEFGFSCLNNRTALHRLLLGYSLSQAGLLDNMIFVQFEFDGWWDHGLPAPTITTQLPGFDDYLRTLPLRVNDNLVPIGKFVDQDINSHPIFSNAYCNIVTESEAGDDVYSAYAYNPHLEMISEKSYKPFINCQIPLMLACKGHVTYLKSLGFEMMEDLLPANYDSMRVLDKIRAITDLVAKGKQFIQDYYFSHLREINHNHDLVSSDAVDGLILQNIKNIL